LVFASIRAARSIISGYGLPTNGKTPEERHDSESSFPCDMLHAPNGSRVLVLIQVDDETTAEMISSQIPIISSLVKGSRDIKVLRNASEVPAGCGMEPVAINVAVHVIVKGKINAADEIAKLEKKSATALQGKDKLEKLAGQANYETAIPAEVRAKNAEKASFKVLTKSDIRLIICSNRCGKLKPR
jgi:valyl-tRNA synthetase